MLRYFSRCFSVFNFLNSWRNRGDFAIETRSNLLEVLIQGRLRLANHLRHLDLHVLREALQILLLLEQPCETPVALFSLD